MADLNRVAPKSLARLMGLGAGEQRGGWAPHELADVLRHQLRAPLLFDQGAMAAMAAAAAGGGAPAAGEAPPGSFEDLFRHPRPPLPLLRLTKDFAKAADRPSDGPIPAEVATVLYYAAIVAALLRHGERISQLRDDELSAGVTWALEQPWLDGALRTLFVEARGRLDVPRQS